MTQVGPGPVASAKILSPLSYFILWEALGWVLLFIPTLQRKKLRLQQGTDLCQNLSPNFSGSRAGGSAVFRSPNQGAWLCSGAQDSWELEARLCRVDGTSSREQPGAGWWPGV